MIGSLRTACCMLLLPLFLAGCGGGGNGSGDSSGSGGGGSGSGGSNGSPSGGTAAPLGITTLELAQTHVLPEGGKSWVLANASESLHLVGQRSALALVQLSKTDASSPMLEGWLAGAKLGFVALSAPNLLPPTEAGGPAYASDRYSATIPATWMAPGLQLRVSASNYSASEFHALLIGADMPVTLRVLPFYLFGASDTTKPFSQVAVPDSATIDEVFAKWPVARLVVENHPAHRADWPTLVIGPRDDNDGAAQPAYVAHDSSEQKDGFASLSSVLSLLGKLMDANGDSPGAFQYYAPMILLDSAGKYTGPGGGLGSVGGDTGAGDISYAGVFIHEQGHAFGLSHAGEAYDAGAYPYEWGSLDGSAWGYDPKHDEFLAPFVPVTASGYPGCASDTFAGHARAIDTSNRCVKQDPMQSGSGDQDPGYKFATFSDFSSAVMQHHLEGTTTVDSGGAHVYDDGYIVRDTSYAGGYKRWDGIDLKWVAFTPSTITNGQYGFLQGFPVQRDVPVVSIALTISKAGTTGATQIYPTLAYTGNLIQYVDPTDATQRAAIDPTGSGAARWYCVNSGCDYTLRVTYGNGTVRHVLLQGGFRSFNKPSGSFPAGSTNPLDSDSFRSYVVSVPNDVTISKIQLLETPMAWTGLPASPTVLATR